jgi:hypothetical protein
MKRVFLLPIIFVLFLIPCFAQKSTIIKTAEFEGIICINFSEWIYLNKDKNFWIPSREQVLEAEAAISKHLKEKKPEQSPKLWQKLSHYKRQYIGIVVDGRKRIYCNFYCSDDSLSDKPIVVDDGGDCYFQVEYEVKTSKIYNLSINGNA